MGNESLEQMKSRLRENALEGSRKRALESFRASLTARSGKTFTETFTIGEDGDIEFDAESNAPDLLLCAPASQQDVTDTAEGRRVRIRYKAKDVREAAEAIARAHPNIFFEIQEAPDGRSIGYTATLLEGTQ